MRLKITAVLILLSIPMGAAMALETATFSYDALGRLIRTSKDVAGPNISTYQYDAASNRQRATTYPEATIPNGDFENPALSSYVYDPAAPGLSFSGSAGISRYGDAWGFPAPWSGHQVAFLQATPGGTGAVEMTAVNLYPGHQYQIAFAAAQRPGYAANSLQVFINGVLVWSRVPASADHFTPYPTSSFVPSSDSVTIRFASSPSSQDSASAIDSISVQRLN
ncbi:hypothetical protein [Sphingomonas fuzhouensis]|uniref:hypothetical protein n=1 Tax=Sphingomonas fuzhouensis TaxID=3106033 RepID=UPI002AFE6C1A|nr:hypothetical protein [Sphingomonas sp. SGZ-02]